MRGRQGAEMGMKQIHSPWRGAESPHRPHEGCPVVNHRLSNSISIFNIKMTLSPGSPKCLKFCIDVEIPNYEGRGEDREGGGSRTDFAWQKGGSLSSAPSPSPCSPPCLHTCRRVRHLPGTLQIHPLAHVVHPLKRRKQENGNMENPLGVSSLPQIVPPTSSGTWGQEEAPGEWLPALDRTGPEVYFTGNHSAAVSTPTPSTSKLKPRLDTPSRATSGGSAMDSHSSPEHTACLPGLRTRTIVKKRLRALKLKPGSMYARTGFIALYITHV